MVVFKGAPLIFFNSGMDYIITNQRKQSDEVEAFIIKGFSRVEELLKQIGNYFLSKNSWIMTLMPMLVLISVFFLFKSYFTQLVTCGLFVLCLWILWVCNYIFREIRLGKKHCFGCYLPSAGEPALVGGMLLRMNIKRRKIMIAGVYVIPEHRQKGITTALLLGLYQLLDAEYDLDKMKITVFDPIHPATKKINQLYFKNSTSAQSEHQININKLKDKIDSNEDSSFYFSQCIDGKIESTSMDSR